MQIHLQMFKKHRHSNDIYLRAVNGSRIAGATHGGMKYALANAGFSRKLFSNAHGIALQLFGKISS